MRVGILVRVLLFLRHPDAAVVAQRLGHERELRLVVAADRDAGRVNLRVAGIGEAGAALVGAPDGGGVGAARVGREIEDVAVAAGREHDGIGAVAGDLAGDQVADDDALRVAVDDDEVEHLGVACAARRRPRRSCARAPSRRRAAAAGRSGRARRRCARPARRRRSGWRAGRRIRGRRARPARRIGR